MQLSMSSLVGKDQKMNGQPFVRFSPRGLQSCAAECKRRPRCLSFNFHLATLMCELNKWGSSSQSANLQTAAGYWFSDVSQWPDNMLGPCDGATCQLTEKCVLDNNECEEAPEVDNAQLLDNVTREVGLSTSYTCNTGYVLEGSSTEITCRTDGHWTPPQFTCRDCGPAPDVPNAVKTNSQTAPGSTTTYECSVGGLVNGPAEITCGSDGTWPPATFSCVDCGPAPDVPNAVKTNSQTAPGSTTTYECSVGGLAQVSGNTGIVLSRNYPGHYVNDEDLTYTITLEQTGPQTVSMSISYNTEIFSDGTCPDYLQINGDSHKYCGTASGVSKTITLRRVICIIPAQNFSVV
nr:hypothetical protein BaRGS_004067 [Batillaria attramentaria]